MVPRRDGRIASTHHLKSGNAMPSYDQLDGPQLRAVAAYQSDAAREWIAQCLLAASKAAGG
jgi:hypothetical protein